MHVNSVRDAYYLLGLCAKAVIKIVTTVFLLDFANPKAPLFLYLGHARAHDNGFQKLRSRSFI